MIAALRSEWRKLWSVRSTYVILMLMVLFIALGGFLAGGYLASGPVDNHKLVNGVLGGTMNIIPQLTAITAILLVAHEYRYNLINYSLTLTNRRSKFLLAKVMVVTIFTVLVTMAGIALTMGLTYLGMRLKGTAIPHQDLMIGTVLWRSVAFSLSFTLLGLSLIVLIRNLAAAIIILLFGISILEVPLSLLLKQKAQYLPTTALSQVLQPILPPEQLPQNNPFVTSTLSPLKGLGVFSIYLVILWIVTWVLFLRRDAS